MRPEEETTDWYPGGAKPVHIGVYQKRLPGWKGYAYWNGKHWGYWAMDCSIAYELRRRVSKFQDVAWRGLSKAVQ